MTVEEKILDEEEKAKLLEESGANKEDVEFGKIYTVNSVKIMRSDKEFFEETAKTIPEVKKCVEKVKPEKEKFQQKITEIKNRLEEAKKAQKNQNNAQREALRALSGRPTKMNQGAQKAEDENQQQQAPAQNAGQAEIEALEKDLSYCKGAEQFIDSCGKEAGNDLMKLENIMAAGKVQSWSVLVDFEVAPLPSEREKSMEDEKNKDKEKDGNDNKAGNGASKPAKGLKGKFDAIRGINNSERAAKSESGKPREAVRGPERPPLKGKQLDPSSFTYLKDQMDFKR